MLISWTFSNSSPKGGSTTAPPMSMETRKRYDAVLETVFLAKERGQLQSLVQAPGTPSDSQTPSGGVTKSAPQSGPRKERTPLGDEATTTSTKDTMASTVGRQLRTSPARGRSVSKKATPHPAAANHLRTSVSRGVYEGWLLHSRLSRFVGSLDSVYVSTPR